MFLKKTVSWNSLDLRLVLSPVLIFHVKCSFVNVIDGHPKFEVSVVDCNQLRYSAHNYMHFFSLDTMIA